jgi:hypothetical protein
MGLFDDLKEKFSQTNSEHIGQAVEEMVSTAIRMRKQHERRWFDNNFFDDGYHFRVVSKRTGRVIDHVNYSNGYIERAIPRASRQIRGVTNLLFAAEPYPVVYPQRITQEQFINPETRQLDQVKYQEAMDVSKKTAKLQGNWISNEWVEQELSLKLIDMIINAAKNSVAYLQVYSDTDKEKIRTNVYDAFDIVTYGDRRELKEEPFISKICPMDLVDVMKNPLFDPDKVKKLTPDNKYATSEIKDAYMRVRFGSKVPSDQKDGSILVKETFLKEVLTDENWKQVMKGDTGGVMDGKSKGDGVMRHIFSAGAVTLRDEYIDYDDYPFADFRFEPGVLYQTPFIERFIPQNKSIDVIVTRLEKWVNAMVVGVYQKRKGENFQLSNFPGGQVVEYETTPLTQMQNGSVGNTPFNVIEMLDKYIDEQGATTAGGMNVPQGVKSGVAIESIKSTEYANLKVSTLMLKKTMKRITELMLERASKDYMEPHEISFIEDAQPEYFDVIGEKGMNMSMQVNKPLPKDVVPLKKDLKVRIEIEPGLGLTMDGKKQAMQQIIEFMIKLASPPISAIPMEAIKQVTKRFMEVFGYGNTQEFMEVLDNAATMNQQSDEDIIKMKVAIIEALRDAGAVGSEMEQRLVDSTKVGVLESMKEAGMIDKPQKSLAESLNISFKDLPEDTKKAVIVQLGLPEPKSVSPAGSDQISKHVDSIKPDMSSFPISKFRKNIGKS